MAILEAEVWIPLKINIAYYENLGYYIPKQKDKQGRMRFPIGSKILVKTEHLPKGSNIKVTKICDDCGKEIPNRPYYDIVMQRKNGDGQDRCQKCANTNSKRNIIPPFERSLEYWAIKNNKEYLLNEFSSKNNVSPDKVFKGSDRKYWWNCPDCPSEYDMTVDSRTSNNHNCPYCSGMRVNHTNCLWSTHPEIAALLENKQNGYEVTAGSNKRDDFKCNRCDNIIRNKIIAQIAKHGLSCPKCSDGISYPEKFIFNVLEQLNIPIEKEKIFEWSNLKRYDFFIPSLNCIIEANGDQHYSGSFNGRDLINQKENDSIKQHLANENKIQHYISIDCSKSELEYIKNNVITSKLSDLIDLGNIDWMKCHEYACSTMIKNACDLWEKGVNSTIEISNILKLHRSTISRYLKQGSALGWCDYDAKKAMINNGINAGEKNKRKIIQLSLGANMFIKEWESIRKAEKELEVKNISRACSNTHKTVGGFKWMYKEDYEKYIEEQNRYSDELILS